MLIGTSALLALFLLAASAPSFPEWARQARLAGASFEPEMSDAQIDKKLDKLAAEGVSVVVADAPTGWSYVHLVDDAPFAAVVDLMANRVIPRAHARGLRVAWYLTTLELVSVKGVKSGRDPAAEHPDWVQIDRFGAPVSYAGKNAFWLNKNDIDTWVGPETPYRAFYLGRAQACAAAGADALWFDVAYYLNDAGQHGGLWPSCDPHAAAAFLAAYGVAPIPQRDFDDPDWRRFVRFRQQSIASFASAVAAAAHAVDADVAVFFENWSIDWVGATTYAQDALDLAQDPDLATAHELCPLAQGGAGMGKANLKNWLDYAAMVKFCVESNQGRPAWILSYAGSVSDSLRQAGVHVALGANFYEARGPEMVDHTTGSRPELFPWIAANEDLIYGSESVAEVAVYYSPRTRDFVDRGQGGGSGFQLGGAPFFGEYRRQTRRLLRRGIAFDLVAPGTLVEADKTRYRWLLLPNVECVSDAEAAWLADFAQGGGNVACTQDSGRRDEWGALRAGNALAALEPHAVQEIDSDLVQVLLKKSAARKLLAEVRSGTDAGGAPFLLVPLVHMKKGEMQDVPLRVRLPPGFTPQGVRATSPDAGEHVLPFLEASGYIDFTVPRVKTVTLAVVTAP
ncbi:MAG: beta-galactosidase trimerization domain-containing protein [Planctomycetes bacterium]|nr:beta-galactosidase trimerization domain-containing protein [Planctomycetota bacterium]